jgi:N-acetylglucosaminyldiphosphoundecaprenol N-acetyl-beta-D-mannosaminyltransferase
MTRFLIVQIADIGDLVLSTPALAALREAQPDAGITVLTTPHAAPILQHTGLADAVLTVPRRVRPTDPALFRLARTLRAGKSDAILYFHHFSTRAGAVKHGLIALAAGAPVRAGLDNGNAPFLTHKLPDAGFGAVHQAQYWLNLAALFGAKPNPRPAVVGMSEGDRAWAAETLPEGAYIAVHGGSGGYSLARRWDADKLAEAANRIAERDGAQIVVVGGRDDNNAAVMAHLRVPYIDLTGKTTLNQLAAALARCRRFIGADSGVLHIAAAVGCEVTAVFGPSNHAAWRPWTPKGSGVVVRSNARCSPCSYVGTGVGAREGCAARTCMKWVTTEDVINPKAIPEIRPTRAAPTVTILGCPVSRITYADWLDLIGAWMQGGGFHHVVTLNPEMVMIARRDPVFRVVVERADLTPPDGVGLLIAARLRGERLPERVTGSDGVPLIAERAAREGWRLFLLGAAEGVAQMAADELTRRYPGLQIAGVYAGSPDPAEEDALVARINAANADILLVAYGAPEQDKWIARCSARLNVKMAMGIGGSLDFIAGVVPRAPERWRRMGVEWLYRLIRQPWRWRRMLRLPGFLLLALMERKQA